jgi:hypothetical protein
MTDYSGDEERLGKAERYFRKLGKVAGFEAGPSSRSRPFSAQLTTLR